ncbi:unnamed protein product [Caenorhabditis brenneri]
MAEQNTPAEYPGFKIGDRVRSRNEAGTIRFIGYLKGHSECFAGIDFDNLIGAGTGVFNREQLFHAKDGHAAFVSISELELIKDPKDLHVRKFDESVSDVSDMKLKVGEETFYVSKLFLAGQSAYFKTMFLGKFAEANQSEVELKDIEPDVFHSFLEVLHGELVIRDDNVKKLLELDDMYDCETLRRRCEEHLLNNSKIGSAEKLHLSCRFKLPKLNKSCLEQVKTVADIRKSLPEDITQLNFNTVAELLQKFTEIKIIIETFYIHKAPVVFLHIVCVPLMVFGGFMITYDAIPWDFLPLAWISWYKYGFEAITIVFFESHGPIAGCGDNSTVVEMSSQGNCSTGPEFIKDQAFEVSNLWIDYTVILAALLFWKILGVLAFSWRIWRA